MAHVSLELITDIDIHHFIDNSIRGGISMTTTRYTQANASTLSGYDAIHPHVHLIYLDVNNLYGWALSQPLPTGGFRFLQSDEIVALKTDTYMRWTSTIHNIYTMLATITHSPPSRWKSIVICIHIYPLSMHSFHRLHLKGNSLLI